MIEIVEHLSGPRLGLEDTVQFQCEPSLACFNSCCSHKRLPLFPYDMLRLRRGLGLSSPAVLAQYTELELEPGSGWPVLRIKLQEDGRCPWVSERGCQVYEHRPTCCRIYPLVRAVAPGSSRVETEEIFLLAETTGCLGWQEPRTLTVRQWIEEQGLAAYRAANNRLLQLLFHPRRKVPLMLDEWQSHALVLALYNLDVFRQALAAEGFATRFSLDPARIEQAYREDEILLELGQDWLIGQLFGQPRAR
jgi:uncharacterized protein